MSSKGKVALITGGGKNLGAERARQLAKEGTDLALHYDSTKNKDQTLQFRNEVLRTCPGIKVSVHGGDLGTATAVEKLFSDVLTEHKKIDIVVNTAGIVRKKPITNISEAEYDQMFAYALFVDEQRRRTVDQYQAELTRRQFSNLSLAE